MEIVNRVRGFAYLGGVLDHQQADPLCRACSAFANTLAAVREELAAFEAQHADALRDLPVEFAGAFAEAKARLSALKRPADPVGQKKAGNCNLPPGVCFVKSSLATFKNS